ncbi:MAG: quinolinate synthase NadA [Cyanobacteriota bacterium]
MVFAAAQNTTGGCPPHAQLPAAIAELKRQRNAVILAHYYQEPEIQDIADFIGDSLELSRKAAATDADVIVFCGVHFMAEVAKILSPEKTVLLPDLEAGCTLADACPADAFASFRAEHPEHLVVSYINCSAAVKAQSDLICTSSNAVDLVKQLPGDRPILFAPDQNLGRAPSCLRRIRTLAAGCKARAAASSPSGPAAASCTKPSASRRCCS